MVAYCSEGARLRPTFKQAQLALKEAKPTHCPEGAPSYEGTASSEQGKALRRKVNSLSKQELLLLSSEVSRKLFCYIWDVLLLLLQKRWRDPSSDKFTFAYEETICQYRTRWQIVGLLLNLVTIVRGNKLLPRMSSIDTSTEVTNCDLVWIYILTYTSWQFVIIYTRWQIVSSYGVVSLFATRVATYVLISTYTYL